MILKEARNSQSFNAEASALDGYLGGHDSFRQLVNLMPDKKIIVYEHLSDNLHNVLYTRTQRKLEEDEVKRLNKVVLKGLATMHKEGFAHTGILKMRFSNTPVPTAALLMLDYRYQVR